MTRRDMLALLTAASAAPLRAAPTAPVSIRRCQDYSEDVTGLLGSMFDDLGGLGRLVGGKTVTVKLNMTGDPAVRLKGLAPAVTHYCHPKVVGGLLHQLDRAGAKRIRLVEGAYGTAAPLDECMLNSGWNVRSLRRAARAVEFENTNNLGSGANYARLAVPCSPVMFPAYDLNHSYLDTDVFVSLAKLKEHANCGVTLSMKNCFGALPISIYGDEAGLEEPNENPAKGRGDVCHFGKRAPSRSAPGELNPQGSHEDGYRVPRITAELVAARPIHLAVIDGVESLAGGEGPWIGGVRHVRPGVLLAGLNPVATDAAGTAVMGHNPRAIRDEGPFRNCDNTLLLAEELGVGTADLSHIDVRGLPLGRAVFPY